MKEFRNLYADEIMIRPTDTKYKGKATLLLYQDARCAMDILDETVGSENWQKEYYEVKGNVYCRIGILTDNGWIWKSDCGIESNVDAQKGEASDAFKRAAVNFGIGRELYSGPRVKINCPDSYYYNDHLTMTFYVKDIAYDGKRITTLVIADKFDNIVFKWSLNGFADEDEKKKDATNEEKLIAFCKDKKPSLDESGNAELVKFYKYWKEKVDKWKGVFDPYKLWESWKSKAA